MSKEGTPNDDDKWGASGKRLFARVTVSASRSKESAEARRKEIPPLVRDVISAAKGSAIIRTSTPSGLLVRRQDGEFNIRGGLYTFGDGSTRTDPDEVPSHFLKAVGDTNAVYVDQAPYDRYATDMVEAVAFIPATADILGTVEVEKRSGLLNRPKIVEQEARIGEEPISVENPIKKHRESGVYFDYTFNPLLAGTRASERLGMEEYKGSDPRDGNRLVIRTLLPESLSHNLRQAIEQDPQIARQVAEEVVIHLGGVKRERWLKGAGSVSIDGARAGNRMKPPYETLPALHRLYIVEQVVRDSDHRKVLVARKIDKPIKA